MKKGNIISPLALFGVWELVARLEMVDPLFLPAPTAILAKAWELTRSGELLTHIFVSLCRVGMGYGLGALIGVGLGILVGWSRKLEEYVDPLIEMIRPISPLALLPLMILWFGMGDGSKVIIIFKASLFPILLNTIAGVKGVDIRLIQAAQTLGAGRGQVFSRVVLPASLPTILTGLRISTALAMLAIVGVEMLAAESGLGYMLVEAEHVFDTPKMFVGLLALGALGYLWDGLARLAQNKVLVWHKQTTLEGEV
ncbi:MAG: ABC transporter permease [Thermodesulfobacteriota bacterium]|nr:ABC transporter permease [Thermodesulfobacteriota bacterium]